MRLRPITLATIALSFTTLAPLAAEPSPTPEQRACAVIQDGAKHIGETITFRGEYHTDHIERSLVKPLGCDRGIGLGGGSDPEVWKPIQAVESPVYDPWRRIEATFTGTVVQRRANGMQYANDDGVRLRIDRITDVTWQPGDK